MFAKTIIDSDAFIDMPLSTQALYFHLSMRADDDGFINNPKKIQRMIGASDDDYKVLVSKNFIIPFESGIVVIKHWRIHNYIRGDRKKETVYAEEMNLLSIKGNGAYTFREDIPLIENDSDETPRQRAYKESSLPYSFEYKIRNAFVGRECPVCHCTMSHSNNLTAPTIQHNIPISKGGKHELGNISVICRSCNSSIKDNPTENLNSDEVIKAWDDICQTSDGQVVGKCPTEVRLGKVSIGKVSIGKVNNKTYFEDEDINKTFLDYMDMRKKIKAPMTDRAIELAIKNLNKLSGGDKEKSIAILNQSIMNSWKGLFELKDNKKNKFVNFDQRSYGDKSALEKAFLGVQS